MRCSATSRRTSSAKCSFTSERGTCPLRKPGRRACFWTRPYARSHSFWTTSAGASTWGLARGLPTLDEVAILGAKPYHAVGADAVGELQPPAGPGHDALHERVAVVPRMPGATAQEHVALATFIARVPCATDVPGLVCLGIMVTCRASCLRDGKSLPCLPATPWHTPCR